MYIVGLIDQVFKLDCLYSFTLCPIYLNIENTRKCKF